MFAERGKLQGVRRFMRAKERPGAGGEKDLHRPELARCHSGYEKMLAETDQCDRASAAHVVGEQQHRHEEHQQQRLHVKEERVVQGWIKRPVALPRSALRAGPERCGGAAASRPYSRGGEAAGGRVVGGASSSDRWAALKVSIPRLEVNGPTAKVVSDGGSSSGSATAADVAAAGSGVSPTARGWRGVAGGHSSQSGNSDGEFGGIAPGNSATTVSAAMVAVGSGVAQAERSGVAVSSLLLTDSQPLGLPAIRGTPEGILDQSRSPPTPTSKNMSPVEILVNYDGEAVFRFSKSAPCRRGKWSRMEEEYAKRIISDFDDGVLDAPAGIGLRQLLSSKLHCEVMRVSKKFCGWQCVGKRCYRPVFHHDGRTTRARASLFEMEQNWLKTFPTPSRSKSTRTLSTGGDGSGGDSATSVDGGSESPAPLSPAGGVGSRERGATPDQTLHSGVEQGLAEDTSTGAVDSPGKEGLSHRERALFGSLDEEPRDPPSKGERVQEVEKKLHDGRGVASRVADGGDQLQMRAVSRAGGHDHRGSRSRETRSGSNADPNGHHGVNRRSWTPLPSHESHYMKGATAPSKPVASPREQQHCDNMRPPAGLSLLRRERDRLLNGSAGGCDRDADPYPVFSKRRDGAVGAAVALQRVANEGTAAAGGRHGVSRESGNGWAQGQEAHPYKRQSQFPNTNSRRGGAYACENSHDRYPEGVRTAVSVSPAGRMSLASRGHDVRRHEVSADDQTYPDPFPHYEPGRQLAAPGRYTPRKYSGNGGRAARSNGGRTTFRLKPEPAALPLHLRVDNHTETFFPGNEQAATIAPELGRYLPEAPHRAGPPPESSSKRHNASRQFSEGPEHQYYLAKAERRAWEDSLAAGLEEYRPAKTPRMTGSFSYLSAGGRGGGRVDDDGPLYPKYQKHQQKHHQQRQRLQRHPGTATAIYWESGQTHGDACATVEVHSPASLSKSVGGDATPPHRPPSRDCFFRVSSSPISTVVPSNEYGPVVVGRGRVVQSFSPF